MNATSARDSCYIPETHILGPKKPKSRMKRVHTTTKKNPQQEDNPYDFPKPTENPTTPKAKKVCPTFRAENLQINEDNSETDETPSIPNFLFSSSTTPSSDSIQQMLSLSLDDSRITQGEYSGKTQWSSSLYLLDYLYKSYSGYATISPQSHVLLLECSVT